MPTHALELVEYAAARKALLAGRVEARVPPRLSLDALAQHCVTLALGGGFDADTLFAEVRGTHAFAALDAATWQAVLDFIVQGGKALAHYPDYHRVVRDETGVYRVVDRKQAFRHRLSIGTITSDGHVSVQFAKGGRLGAVEESFIGRMRPGDRFLFAGKTLELMQLKDMTAYVKLSKRNDGIVPRWQGSRMPLSSMLAEAVQATLAGPRDTPELRAVSPLLDAQAQLSALPTPDTLLVEQLATREGWHLFLYPFAGRAVHEGLAALLALRWGRLHPNTFAFAVNDYGLAITAQSEHRLDQAQLRSLLTEDALLEDLQASLNLAEMARRQFRDIARVSGLLSPALPGRAPRSMRQLQVSSGLLFDVLSRFDADHLLLEQARREVFEAQLEVQALKAALADCAGRRLSMQQPASLTPLSFPLWAEAMRGSLSTEDWGTRMRRAAEALERKHG